MSALTSPCTKYHHIPVALSLVLVVRTTSLKQRLIDPSTAGNNPHRRTRAPRHCLLRTTREPNARLVVLGRVSDNSRVVTRRAREGTAVADLLLDIADDGTLGALRDGENVADGESRFFAAVDEGAGVETFGGDEGFFAEFVAVGVAEDHTGEGGTAGFRGSEGLERIQMD